MSPSQKIKPDWRDESLPPIARRDAFLKSKPTDAEWECYWPELQRAARDAEIEAEVDEIAIKILKRIVELASSKKPGGEP